MRSKALLYASAFFFLLGSASAQAKSNGPQFPQDVGFTTLRDGTTSNSLLLPFPIEGLTGDDDGNLYTTGRAFAHSTNGATSPNPSPTPCPVWKIQITPGTLQASFIAIGSIPNADNAANPAAATCGPSGITFDSAKNLYAADSQQGGVIWKLTRQNDGTYVSPASISDAYAVAVPGTNGVAFDRNGNLWTGDGVTGQGRVWKITGSGANCTLGAEVKCAEVFRVQPTAATNLEIGLAFSGGTFGSGVTSVGRDPRTLPPGTIDANRANSNSPGGTSQPLVANGVAFNHEGDLFVLDSARGAIWRAQFDRAGNLKSPTGCDDAFTENTLCLSNVFVAHPILEGADGMVLDVAGNFWVDANERNAVAAVTKDGQVIEIFRNPLNAVTHLRNSADTAEGNTHILEFPTSPFLSGARLCTAQSDGNRRDNSPRSAGEIDAGRAFASPDVGKRAKISCMTDSDTGNLIQVNIPGMPLPVH